MNASMPIQSVGVETSEAGGEGNNGLVAAFFGSGISNESFAALVEENVQTNLGETLLPGDSGNVADTTTWLGEGITATELSNPLQCDAAILALVASLAAETMAQVKLTVAEVQVVTPGLGETVLPGSATGGEANAPTVVLPVTESVQSGVRRTNLGSLLDEKFPPGWETLLEDGQKTGQVVSENIKTSEPAVSDKAVNLAAMSKAIIELPLAKLWDKSTATVKVIGGEQPEEQKSAGINTAAVIAKPVPGKIGMEAITGVNQEGNTSNTGTGAFKTLEPEALIPKSQELKGEVKHNEIDFHSLQIKTTETGSLANSSSVSPLQTLQRMSQLQKQTTVEEFVHTVVQSLSKKTEQIWVELNPPELGRVQICLENRGNQVHARLTIQDQEVLDLFKEYSDAIRKTMEGSGIKLGELTVELGHSSGADTFSREKNKNPQSSRQPGAGENRAQPEYQASSAHWQKPEQRGKVDMVV